MPTGYQGISSYDSPEIVASMILEDEFTVRGAREAFFSPTRLTPEELDTFTQRLRDRQENPIVRSIVGIVTNPLTWLVLVGGAPGGMLARVGAGGIFKTARRYSAYVQEKAPFLAQLGVLTPRQALRGTTAPDVYHQIARGVDTMMMEEQAILRPALERVAKSLGVDTLDFTSRRLQPEQARRVRRFMTALQGEMEGWGRNVDVPVWTPGGWETRTREAIVPAGLENVLREGAGEAGVALRDTMRQVLNVRAVRLFGKETPENLVTGVWQGADTEKVLRLWRGLSNPLLARAGGSSENPALEAIRAVLGDRLDDDILKSGNLTLERFREFVTQAVDIPMSRSADYFPRNVWKQHGADGRVLLAEEVARARAATALASSPSSIMRVKGTPLYDPDDLEYVAEQFGRTPELDNLIRAGRSAVDEAVTAGRTVATLSINPDQALHRYFNDTARSWSLHVQDVGDRVRFAQRQYLPYADKGPAIERAADRFDGPVLDVGRPPTGAPLNSIFEDVPLDQRPLGGFSLADAAWQTYALTRNEYGRRLQSHFLVPASTGKHHVEHLATEAALFTGKSAIRNLVEGPFGRVLDTAGAGRLRESLLRWSDPELGGDSRVAQGLAKYLYTTHLGFNGSSASVQVLQPLTLASTWLGARNVMEGYSQGIRELWAYAKDRVARYGVRPITPAQRDELFKRNFRYFEEMGISGRPFEIIDGITFQGGRGVQRQSGFDLVSEYGMKLFQQGEILNRATTAHAAAAAYRRAGLQRSGAPFLRDVESLIQETQFSGSFLNQPVGLVSADPGLSPFGRFGANPLIRMFISYPLRTATSLFESGPKLAGREGMGPLVRDVARGVGISAVAYEVGKEVFGVDLERGLLIAGATDLVPGISTGRWTSREGPFPVPPIVDIPYGILKGWMEDDWDMVRYSAARGLPFGVALTRAVQGLPQLPGPAAALQTTSVDWGDVQPDGTVPIYDSSGELIGYEHGSTMVLRALGLDLGRFANNSEVDKWLIDNRAEIGMYRQRLFDSLAQGEVGQAEQIRAEFLRRFGFQLTVDDQTIQRKLRLMQTPRTERILDQLPAEARPLYTDLVGQQPNRTGLSHEQLTSQGTSAGRSRSAPARGFDPESLEYLERVARERQTERVFTAPNGFNP